jgi:NAD+ kinase
MKAVGLFGKAAHPDVQRVARSLTHLSRDAGHQILVESDWGASIEGAIAASSEEVASRADLAVVLGGDGTMIRAVRLLDEREIPIFGVNLGSLGFLTEFTVDEAVEQFARVMNGDFQTAPRMRLQAELVRQDRTVFCTRILNDVVVNRGVISRIIDIRTEIDGTYVTTFRADGLIVSTPTGSTAYAMAAGGPILMPETEALVVAPICPHMLTMRPLVIRSDSKVHLKIETSDPSIFVTFDGQHSEEIQSGDGLEIRRAPGSVLLVKPPRDHYQILRTRLKWGQR